MPIGWTKEENATYMREWRKNNPDKNREIKRRYYAKPENKLKSRKAHKRWRDANIERIKKAYQHTRRKAFLKWKYKTTPEHYETLLSSQKGLCAICSQPSLRRALSIDHDHITGKLRGLLCDKCNNLLGRCDDKIEILEAAIQYLKIHKGVD